MPTLLERAHRYLEESEIGLERAKPTARDTFRVNPVIEYWNVYVNNIKVGRVYTRNYKDKPVLSIYLSSRARGKGAGKTAVQLAMQSTKARKLYSETDTNNTAMRRIFKSLGWREIPAPYTPSTKGQRHYYVWSK